MTSHLEDLLARENIPFEPEALSMIVRAGEGSVRDNQSLLDQAISHGDGQVTASTVKAMLGLGDRARTIDLFEQLMRGDIASALTLMRELYDAGADPQTLLADLCDFTHLVTRIKVTPAAADDVSLTPDERARGRELAQKLAMRALSRTWQILFKGFDEVAQAGNALQAAEMVLVRLAYAADLPTPDELATKLAGMTPPAAASSAPVSRPLPSGNGGGGGGTAQALRVEPRFDAAPAPAAAPQPGPTALASPTTYDELIALASNKRDVLVAHALKSSLRPISFADGNLEVALVEGADPGIIQTLMARLKLWTGRQWLISLKTTTEVIPTHRELEQQRDEAERQAAHQDPLVAAILDMFPGATVQVRTREEQIPVEAYADAIRDEEEDDE
jgi:DNA polymerase-3 subunit gamma/tau